MLTSAVFLSIVLFPTLARLVEQADSAMYRAKGGGRNRLELVAA